MPEQGFVYRGTHALVDKNSQALQKMSGEYWSIRASADSRTVSLLVYHLRLNFIKLHLMSLKLQEVLQERIR